MSIKVKVSKRISTKWPKKAQLTNWWRFGPRTRTRRIEKRIWRFLDGWWDKKWSDNTKIPRCNLRNNLLRIENQNSEIRKVKQSEFCVGVNGNGVHRWRTAILILTKNVGVIFQMIIFGIFKNFFLVKLNMCQLIPIIGQSDEIVWNSFPIQTAAENHFQHKGNDKENWRNYQNNSQCRKTDCSDEKWEN